MTDLPEPPQSVHDIYALVDRLFASGGTDLHLSVGSRPRIRVDGHLITVPDAAPATDDQLGLAVQELLTSEEQHRLDLDRQVDLAVSWSDGTRFRINVFHQRGSLAMALRRIPSSIPTPRQIGLPAAVEALIERPHGLVLVTGPTGSGKSTTLAAMIAEINRRRAVHVVTVEDPIEYIYASDLALVNQRELGSDTTGYAEALRAALREDPDVVMVGEMRDLETIQLALTLAETGHLVFATVHTNDASQTIDRIVDVFPAGQQDQVRTQCSMTLAAVVSQRLVPRIGGGRVAAYEVLLGTIGVANMIRDGKTRQIRNTIATSSREGMVLLEQSLSGLVQAGVVSLDDARRASVFPDEIVGGPTIG